MPMSRARTNAPSTTIFPKQIFHGLAALLIVSLCLLLVELNSPGIASRMSGSFFGNKPATVAINSKSYYSPVPAPFLTPKLSKFIEIVPTSEPTVLTQMLFDVNSPTSEPTEYKDRMGRFMVDAPTNEPTEYRERYESMALQNLEDGTPTEEPTVFSKDTFQSAGGPTNEPTVFSKDTFQNAGEPTNEPTVFSKDTFQSAG